MCIRDSFPSYAPELNPDEGVWSQAKRKLSNSCPKDVDELMEDIIRSINGVRRSQKKLRGCIEQSELLSLIHISRLLLLSSLQHPIKANQSYNHGSATRYLPKLPTDSSEEAFF